MAEYKSSVHPYDFAAGKKADAQAGLANDGVSTNNPDMETRIALLEHRAAEADKRSERIENKIDAITGTLADIRVALVALPTKRDLTSNTWQIAGVAMVVVGLIVGGIIGGLGWIKPEDKPAPASAVQPIIIQVPSVPAPLAPAPTLPSSSPVEKKQ